ncbi:uncharacterized protein LOC121934657 isoform X1 [Sceloporus undulatus]|uniref:uncharacterized protein LOC121934657 isoform X1 n=1 Tax=Sceloporus undulatus TaxID=8520 RepID=UPI001C4B5DD3|nr:uncharacterized protein LOC121934657 isoform X1 [Sceloporus undulatus]
MFAVLILPFLRGITGATFFRHSDNSEQKLLCSVSSDQNKTGWWFGGTSLQQFGQPTDAYTSCGGTYNKTDPCYTEGKELVFKSPNGGSVACKSLADHETFNQVPLFTNEEDCKNFDFFIVAITQNKAETKTPSTNAPLAKAVSLGQNNFSLACQFKLTQNTGTFSVYWIKEGDRSMCLFSASNEGGYNHHNLSYDTNCCVDAGIKDRRCFHHTTLDRDGQNQSHEITILNATLSDGGKYLCIVTAFASKQEWRIITNVSVTVEEDPLPPPVFRNVLELSLGVIGGLFLLSMIILFLCWKKKLRGKPLELHERDQSATEMDGEDCSPYAISSRNDPRGNEVIYSLAMSPGVNPNTDLALLEHKPASGRQPGEDLQAIYAVVKKN